VIFKRVQYFRCFKYGPQRDDSRSATCSFLTGPYTN